MAARASTGRRAPLAKRSRTRNSLCSTPCDGKSVAERHSLKNPACQSFVWGYDTGFHPLFHLRHMVKAAFTFDGVCPFASAIGRDPRYGADAACACESGSARQRFKSFAQSRSPPNPVPPTLNSQTGSIDAVIRCRWSSFSRRLFSRGGICASSRSGLCASG